MLRKELVSIYQDTVRQLSGEELVFAALQGQPRPANLHVLALGKAAGSMAHGAARAWGELRGVAVGPYGLRPPPGIEARVGEHPTPDESSVQAGTRLLEYAASLKADDFALVLLSGGASALAEVPAPGITLRDLQETTERLLAGGAEIAQINCIRKHLSALKGGRLAAACGAGRIRVLVLSDVATNDPAVIGSGPFSPDPTTLAEAEAIARRYRVNPLLFTKVTETPKTPDPRVEHRILAGPRDLAQRAAAIARERGFEARALDEFMSGDVHEVAERWAEIAEGLAPGTLVAAAGEPTVRLPPGPAPGEGGRAQHLALLVAERIRNRNAAFLAAGSDGLDGNSLQAGAAVDGQSWRPWVEEALLRFDSGSICSDLGVEIPDWQTGTNLADLHLLAIAR